MCHIVIIYSPTEEQLGFSISWLLGVEQQGTLLSKCLWNHLDTRQGMVQVVRTVDLL